MINGRTRMKYFYTVSILFMVIYHSASQNSDSLKAKKRFALSFGKSPNDSLKKHTKFELSFGQNLLFISNSQQVNIRQQSAIVVPTNSVLFFAEFRPQKIVRIPVFLNIATESKQFIVDGQIVSEKASPTFGSGITFKLLQLNIDVKSKLELEMGPLCSFIFDNKNNIRTAPILAARIKICRGENFVMYIGGNYSFGVNVFGILYGTGTVF